MKTSFEKKGYIFEIETKGTDTFLNVNGETALARPYKHSKGGWGYEIDSKKISKLLGAPKSLLFIIHESAKDVAQAIEDYQAQLEAEKAREKEDILSGKKTIKVSYYDGEYLCGYEAFGKAAEVLEELCLAKYVDGWGYLVDSKLVDALGEEFTYQQAREFIRPLQEAEAKKQAEREAQIKAKFSEAKETGKPVILEKYTVDCDGSEQECSTDIITVYAMPDGSTKEIRTHTF